MAFFLASHLIESTSIPLELYFEHRNYIPAMFLFWPICLWLSGVSSDPAWHTSLWMRTSIACCVLVMLWFMTYINASAWGNQDEQAQLWARINPSSMRAQTNAALTDLRLNRPQAAEGRLAPLLRLHPQELQVALNLVAAQCEQGVLQPSTRSAALAAMTSSGEPGALLVSWFERALASASTGHCKGMDLNFLQDLVDAGLANTRFLVGRKQDLYYVQGRIALAQNQPDAALDSFNKGLSTDYTAQAALAQAALLGSTGYPLQGLAHLKYYRQHETLAKTKEWGMPRFHDWVLNKQNYWQGEMAILEHTLTTDANRSATTHRTSQ